MPSDRAPFDAPRMGQALSGRSTVPIDAGTSSVSIPSSDSLFGLPFVAHSSSQEKTLQFSIAHLRSCYTTACFVLSSALLCVFSAFRLRRRCAVPVFSAFLLRRHCAVPVFSAFVLTGWLADRLAARLTDWPGGHLAEFS